LTLPRDECSDGMRRVDEVLGVLEQVVLGEEFGALQLEFCKKNCHHFEDSEENKLIYMDLFRFVSMWDEELGASRTAESVFLFPLGTHFRACDATSHVRIIAIAYFLCLVCA